jgi:hypothetical protein
MLWRELDAQRAAKRWTNARLTHEVVKLSGQPCSPKTMHDRLRHGRRVPWSEARWVVKALDLNEDAWSARWAGAEDRRRGTANAEPATTETSSTGGRNRLSRTVLISGISAVAGVVVLIIVLVWPQPPPDVEHRELVGCALVAVDRADVYRAPGDPASLTTKHRGERITLPRDDSEVTGPDGRRYRLVRAPSRTPNGYAYMLADTLTLIPC